MSGNSVESNSLCPLVKVIVVTSFFLSSALRAFFSALSLSLLTLRVALLALSDLFSLRRHFNSSSGVSLRDIRMGKSSVFLERQTGHPSYLLTERSLTLMFYLILYDDKYNSLLLQKGHSSRCSTEETYSEWFCQSCLPVDAVLQSAPCGCAH